MAEGKKPQIAAEAIEPATVLSRMRRGSETREAIRDRIELMIRKKATDDAIVADLKGDVAEALDLPECPAIEEVIRQLAASVRKGR